MDNHLNTEKETPPLILYKYGDWENKFHRRLIENREIYFASANKFNDPFDCSVSLRYDLWDENTRLESNTATLRKMHPEWNVFKVAVRAKVVSDKQTDDLSKSLEYSKTYWDNFKYNQNGIFCLTPLYNNLLMWSHYANSHKGFCIGFNTILLQQALSNYNKNGGEPAIFYKVQYPQAYPILIPWVGTNRENIELLFITLTTKSREWEYESEWRFIMMGKPGSKVAGTSLNLDDGIIAKVILGCRMDDYNKNEVITFLKQYDKKPKLLVANMAKESFSLEFEELKY